MQTFPVETQVFKNGALLQRCKTMTEQTFAEGKFIYFFMVVAKMRFFLKLY